MMGSINDPPDGKAVAGIVIDPQKRVQTNHHACLGLPCLLWAASIFACKRREEGPDIAELGKICLYR